MRDIMFIGKRICVIIALVLLATVSTGLSNEIDAEKPKDLASKEISSWDGFDADLDKTTDATQSNLVKQFMLAIGFVALLGYGTFYFSKKVIPKLAASKGKNILISDSVSLGQNKTLHIVEIENKKLLIGCAGNSINTLADLSMSFTDISQAYQDNENEV
jgi:flagellar biogenesis protein FliO